METAYITKLDCVFKFTRRSNTKIERQAKPHSVLAVRLKGSCYFDIENEQLYVKDGDVTYIPSNYTYKSFSDKEEKIIAIHFYTDKPLANNMIKIDADAVSIFKTILSLYNSGKTYDALSHIYQLISMIEKDNNDGNFPQVLRDAVEIIKRSITDADFGVESVSQKVGVSSVYLRRLFKEYLFCTPSEYIEKERISRAKSYLQSGYFNVSQTAKKCGYYNTKTFSRAFLRNEGISPFEMLKISKQKENGK